jgi:hypothetical protein
MTAIRKAQRAPVDPIRVVAVEVRKGHYKTLPCDWPRKLLGCLEKIVLRPSEHPRPTSVEILTPASIIKALQRDYGERFVFTIIEDD